MRRTYLALIIANQHYSVNHAGQDTIELEDIRPTPSTSQSNIVQDNTEDSDEAPLNATSLPPMVRVPPSRIQASPHRSTGSRLRRLGVHDQRMARRTPRLVLSLFLRCFPQLLRLTRVQRLVIYAPCACWIPFNRTDIPLIDSGLSRDRSIPSAEEADDVRRLGVKCRGVDWSCFFKNSGNACPHSGRHVFDWWK